MEQSSAPYAHLKKASEDNAYHYYDLNGLNDERVHKLPFSIRVLLEAAVRNCDNFNVKRKSYLIPNRRSG